MAILIMAGEEENPTFHDFFGMSCTESAAVPPKKAGFFRESRVPEASASVGASSGAHGPVSASSDLGSERQAGNNPEGVQFQGSMSDLSGPEMSKGRKRSNSDLAFMGSVRDRIHHVGPDSLESVHLLKMFPKEAGGERPRSHGDELAFAMQPPRSNSTAPLLLQPPISSRPELVVSSWDRSVPMNVGPAVHHPSRLGQLATYVDKFSSNRYKDGSPSTSLITQPAADEGSRTGIKGSGILNVTNATSGAAERNLTGVLLNSSKPKAVPLNNEIETSSLLSRHSSTPTSRQMTIFYDGQAHVFDDVHPTKADAIMALAGSSGGSWSTNYLSRSSVRPPLSEAYVPNRENEMGTKDIALSQDRQGRLSTLGTSNGSSHGGRISYPGAHQGLRQTRDTRTVAQASDPNTEGKREYDASTVTEASWKICHTGNTFISSCTAYNSIKSARDPGYALERAWEETVVKFDKDISDELLLAYVRTREGADKAGGYGIQGTGAILVERIEGSFDNVVGLPLRTTLKVIEKVIAKGEDEDLLDVEAFEGVGDEDSDEE